MNEPTAQRPAMSAYGVPDDPDGILPWTWAAERLTRSRNYWLTHVDPSGRPHSMPLWGVWDDETNTFWFGTDASSFRVRNMSANPAVVVAADDTVEVVSVEGTATKVDNRPATAQRAAELWGAKYAGEAGSAEDLTSFFLQGTVFRVDPVKAFGIIERAEEFGPSATRWVWG